MLAKFTKNYQSLITKHIKAPLKYKKPPGFDDITLKLNKDMPLVEALHLLRFGMSQAPICGCGAVIIFKLNMGTYPLMCTKCNKAKAMKSNSLARGIKLLVYGVTYDSVDEAVKSFNIGRDDVMANVLNKNKTDWIFENNHTQKCLDIMRKIHPAFLNGSIIENHIHGGLPIYTLMESFGIKHYYEMKLVYSFYGYSTEFKQVPDLVHETLDDKIILSAMYDGLTQGEIAKQINCSESLVCKALKKHGIPTHEYSQSAIERTLITYIQSISDYEVLPRYRGIGMEIDIFIPALKLGIELDGLRFHCNTDPNDHRSKQEEKHKVAYKNGITLLQFTDIGETIHKLPLIKSMIAHRLGTDEKIHARQCDVVLVKPTTSRLFFEANHISGFANAKFHYGLEFNGELVMMMTFGKPRFSKEADWELIRMASKQHITVVGGASKLISNFRKNNNGTILSYASLRHGTGAVYSAIGFKRIRRTESGYFYTDMKQIHTRHKFQKKNIQNMCKIYDPSKTEAENAYANGYTRYRDSGNLVYILD